MMKIRKKLFLIFLLVVLSFTLFTSCKANNPPPASVEGSVEAAGTEKPEEQPLERPEKEQAEQPKIEQESQPSGKAPEETSAVIESEATPTPLESDSKPSVETPEVSVNDKSLLKIEGSGIEKAVTLSLDDLKAMIDAYYEDDYFSLNSYGTKEYFSFKGVKLGAILEKAGMKESATGLTFIASDGYKFELSLEQALKDDYIDEQNPDKRYPVIIAWHENGQDYDASRGAPFRLIIGQKEPGDVNKPQWVQNVSKITVN
jgi:DMSO/TMAO reductase YedYZ molybdopterin-dependent catalytic subunit